MKGYYIADLKCNMQLSGRSLQQAEKYKVSDMPYDTPDIVVQLSSAQIQKFARQCPMLSEDEIEYYLSGYEFYKQILSFDGCLLHASAVAYQGRGYCFSADSGVGKSTHTDLWVQHFKGAAVINDDKPVLRCLGDQFYVYGTPWSGKVNLNLNVKVPLAAICFLKRGRVNEIQKISTSAAIGKFVKQTFKYHFKPDKMDQLFKILDRLFLKYNAYELACLPNRAAAELAYNTFVEVDG